MFSSYVVNTRRRFWIWIGYGFGLYIVPWSLICSLPSNIPCGFWAPVKTYYVLQTAELYRFSFVLCTFYCVIWLQSWFISFSGWTTTCLGKSCSFDLPRVPFVNCCQYMYLVVSLLVLREGCGIWLYQFLIIAYCFTFLIEAPLYTTDHVSENTFDQTETNNRQIVV